ncbi:poly-gamma-glutamate synthase PgsB [Natronincola ferrireducens]|uniref:Poly-gamma-glutamate synthase PgsB/CapB n=1 Tax=Natronincola ferrireducens TaxID=393762 RepID=A0A1G8XF52_9FIRM|nr:poly-gamma-glutamate synthase PgsB [Natronincola ferrireducens]SDJ89056.1 poly-gamma-glutamate synthase PgsB/CapB [Natronincola ferrireducens]
MGLILFIIMIALFLGILEKKTHQKRVESIPLRVNVNGIRGKSTATRLITGILKEAGLKTVGKTTGTQARMIYWFTHEEKPIKRKPQGPNIGEQIKIVEEAAKLKAQALVSECMAVKPDYQIIFQEQMVQANVGVIVNVLEDHMDVLGPTLDEVAEAFTATIPYNGHLIITQGPYVEYFKKVAAKRGTKVTIADTSKVSEEYLRKFHYILFPENVAIGMAVAEALEIEEEVALRGMLNAQPDPGVLQVLTVGDSKTPAYFVNGFAANDAASTLNIWKRIEELGYPTQDAVMLMNCRSDRVDRTEQFAQDVLPNIPADVIVVIGGTVSPIVEAYKAGKLPVNKIINLEGKNSEEIYEVIQQYFSNRVIYGMGNIHGSAEPLVEMLEEKQGKEKVAEKDLAEAS